MSQHGNGQTRDLSTGDLESVRTAFGGHEVVQRNYALEPVIGYEVYEGKFIGGLIPKRGLVGFTLSDVQQVGDFLLMRGSDKLYVRVEDTQKVAPTQGSTPAIVAIYLPSIRDTHELAGHLREEVFFPDIATAIAAIPESYKGCVPQVYSPAKKAIVSSTRCPSPLSETALHPPTIKQQVNPELPGVLLARTGQWSALVSCVIDEKGSPTAVHVVRPSYLVGVLADGKSLSESEGQAMDDSAVAAVRRYRFKPATRDGLAVPYHLFVEIHYQSFGH